MICLPFVLLIDISMYLLHLLCIYFIIDQCTVSSISATLYIQDGLIHLFHFVCGFVKIYLKIYWRMKKLFGLELGYLNPNPCQIVFADLVWCQYGPIPLELLPIFHSSSVIINKQRSKIKMHTSRDILSWTNHAVMFLLLCFVLRSLLYS